MWIVLSFPVMGLSGKISVKNLEQLIGWDTKLVNSIKVPVGMQFCAFLPGSSLADLMVCFGACSDFVV